MGEKKKMQGDSEQIICKKNDMVTFEITDIGTEGEGVGKWN